MARRKRRKLAGEAPTSSCLMICDDVLMSVGRDKHTLHGVINGIVIPELPAVIGPYVAYIRLSNVYGGSEILISFCTADSDEEIFRLDAKAPDKSDPLQTHTLIIRIPAFAVEAAGRYIFSASHGGVPFAQSPIEISTLERN